MVVIYEHQAAVLLLVGGLSVGAGGRCARLATETLEGGAQRRIDELERVCKSSTGRFIRAELTWGAQKEAQLLWRLLLLLLLGRPLKVEVQIRVLPLKVRRKLVEVVVVVCHLVGFAPAGKLQVV